jgi:hypothetical protein
MIGLEDLIFYIYWPLFIQPLETNYSLQVM